MKFFLKLDHKTLRTSYEDVLIRNSNISPNIKLLHYSLLKLLTDTVLIMVGVLSRIT